MFRNMFNKLLMKSEKGFWIGVFILLFPLLLIFLVPIYPFIYFEDKKIKKAFKKKLLEHEGLEIFTYTSRKKSKDTIENYILPKLPQDLHIVYLNGRAPVTSLDTKFISQVLGQIKNIGFPNIVKISGGKLKDVSIKKEFYAALNKGNNIELVVELIKRELEILRKD